MLTPEDIKKLTEFQLGVFKDVFLTSEEFQEHAAILNEKFSNLQTSVDAIAKDNLTKGQEQASIAYRVKTVEEWIEKATPKLDLEFKH